jgi:uncharacterized protein (DUF433 family)
LASRHAKTARSGLCLSEKFIGHEHSGFHVLRITEVIPVSCARLRENVYMAQAISKNPETMHGVPVFRGTRVPVQTLFDYLQGGDTLEDFLAGFPTVQRAQALQVLEEAKQLLLSRV